MSEKPRNLTGWLDFISSQHSNEIELGLGRLRQAASLLGLEAFQCPVITVAGTNGKGSSISSLEKIYSAAGFRSGCYTSPHLTVFNERIRIAEAYASDEKICNAFARIDSTRGAIPLTYFEFATLAAFIIFTESELDIILLEVGLGGRLDASNLYPADLALVTSIGIDHVDWLGKDRETIAVEKAGIIHTGKIAVIADPDPPQSLLVIAKQKAEKVYCLNQDYSYQLQQSDWCWKSNTKTLSEIPLPGLQGKGQFNNLAGVLMCISALQHRLPVADETLYKVLPDIKLMGRFQVLEGKPQIILDVSHNPDSTALLAENLRQQPVSGKTYALVGMLKDKDISESLSNVFDCIDFWSFTDLEVSRGEKSEVLDAVMKSIDPSCNGQLFTDINDAWEHVHRSAGENDRIVVFGSFHTVGAIIERLSLN